MNINILKAAMMNFVIFARLRAPKSCVTKFVSLNLSRSYPLQAQMRTPCQRSFSVDGAESEEDAHEIMFYSLRKPATVTLKEMYAFGASSTHSTRTLLLAAQVKKMRKS